MWSIGRAASLVWIQIGKKKRIRQDPDSQDRTTKTVGTFALHLQTAFRFSTDQETLLASRDIYMKAGDDPYDRDFDWRNSWNTRFDVGGKKLLKPPLKILGVEADNAGGFRLYCERGIKLEVIPDDSIDSEHWRLLEFGVAHYVMEGSQLEIHDTYERRKRNRL